MAEIIDYKNTNIQGSCRIEKGFVPYMDIVNAVCELHGFNFCMTSSKRESTLVPGAIVTPAQMSNHLVGHAVDGNLKEIATGEWYNSKKMGDGRGNDECVIREIEAAGLTWGGEFRSKDEVHFDDRLNIKDPARWHELNKILNNH